MRRRIVHAVLVALAVVLPATLARASGTAVADCGAPCQAARVDFWQPTPTTLDVWLTAVARARPVTGTFRFYVDNYVFSSVTRVRQTSGRKPACAIEQVTYGVANPTQVPVLVCRGLNLPAGAKLGLELPVTPRAGVSGSVIGDYDFGGTGLPQQAANWSPKPLPEFTASARWIDKKARKLELRIANVGSVKINTLKIYSKVFKAIASVRKLQSVGHCTGKRPYFRCPKVDVDPAAQMALGILTGAVPPGEQLLADVTGIWAGGTSSSVSVWD